MSIPKGATASRGKSFRLKGHDQHGLVLGHLAQDVGQEAQRARGQGQHRRLVAWAAASERGVDGQLDDVGPGTLQCRDKALMRRCRHLGYGSLAVLL